MKKLHVPSIEHAAFFGFKKVIESEIKTGIKPGAFVYQFEIRRYKCESVCDVCAVVRRFLFQFNGRYLRIKMKEKLLFLVIRENKGFWVLF